MGARPHIRYAPPVSVPDTTPTQGLRYWLIKTRLVALI